MALHTVFAKSMSKADWVRMNRPMASPLDSEEEHRRLIEYSQLLQSLHHSELVGKSDPGDESSYPALILQWQYEEGILINLPLGVGSASKADFAPKLATKIFERQSEYARRLAFYLAAKDARLSVEYLQKICRKWEPRPPGKFLEDQGIE